MQGQGLLCEATLKFVLEAKLRKLMSPKAKNVKEKRGFCLRILPWDLTDSADSCNLTTLSHSFLPCNDASAVLPEFVAILSFLLQVLDPIQSKGGWSCVSSEWSFFMYSADKRQ